MATDHSIQDLLASGDEALAEAGFRTGDFTSARELFEQARDEAAQAGDTAARARALAGLGMVAHYQNLTALLAGSAVDSADIDAEEQLFRQALASSPDAGPPQALFGLGLVFQVLHSDWMTAMPYFWQALEVADAPEADAGEYLRSEVHRHVGFYFLAEEVQPEVAISHLQISLDLREQLGDPRRIPSGLVALGEAELSAGHRDQAVELLTRAVAQAREAGLLPQWVKQAEKTLHAAQASGDNDAGEDEPESTEPESTQPENTQPDATGAADDDSPARE
jgi:tetratricopeptide (TPR) repeat protein